MLKKIWNFLWNDDSLLSWIICIIVAFVVIKFLVYPGLGLAMGTTHPIVAVVSGSMEHDGSFDKWWMSGACYNNGCTQAELYSQYNITKERFLKFPFKNGFNTGDLMLLYRAKPEKLKVGDILVFKSSKPDPIIHRIIKINNDGTYIFQTKGDHNPISMSSGLIDETSITKDKIVGKAFLRIPWLGWVKIGFVEIVNFIKA